MTLLALTAVICFGFAVYNLTCAFADIPTKRTSRMMLLARKQQGVKAEKLLDVYITKIAGLIAPYLKLDKLKRNKLQRALDIAAMELTPEVYTARAWVTAGAVGLSSLLMAFLIPLMVPVLIGLAVALWFSTYYKVFDFVKKRRKLIENEIPRFALMSRACSKHKASTRSSLTIMLQWQRNSCARKWAIPRKPWPPLKRTSLPPVSAAALWPSRLLSPVFRPQYKCW